MKLPKVNRRFQKFAVNLLTFIYQVRFNLRIVGRENIPKGGCVVCANHSSVADPPLVAVAISPKDEISVMAKKELFEKNKVFGYLISLLGAFPVDRSRADITAIKTSLKAVKRGAKFIIFPEGTRTTKGSDVGAKEGVAVIAHKCKAPVLPVYVSEEKKFRGKVEIIIGKPFYTEIDKTLKRPYKKVADDILNRIYSLPKGED